jgi:pimeloyl-ACP methyl ester carboxylesterase
MLPDLTSALAERFRVIAPERRGHGRSPDVEGPITYEAMAHDTIALMETLGVREAHLVGYSDGANIGMLVAMWRAELVRRLVLVSGNYDAAGMTRQFVLGMRRVTAERFEPAFADAYRRLSPDGPDHWPVVFEKLKRMMLEEPHIPREELGRIGAPALVLAGDRDFVTVAHSVDLYEAIPDARLCIVPGGSHGLLTERPGLCNQVILDFLE